MGQREELLRVFNEDRIYAHEILFPHRHKDKSPEVHRQTLELFYSPNPLVAEEAFRGFAKSTLIEEYVILSAMFREFKFGIFVGNAYGMACERLSAVKQELTNNDGLIELFGDQHGPTWSEGEIILANGIKIQALGARQSMRGVKHYDARPDLVVVDDLEDEEMVATKEAIAKNKRWFNGTLRPALDPKHKIRMVGTPLHPEALIEQVMASPEWKTLRFPICYVDENGVEQSTWPDRFPMEWIARLRAQYLADGSLTEFEQEYMCRSENAALKSFKADMIRVAPVKSTYVMKKLIVDPARTVDEKKSAQTGYVAESWIGNKLVVHEAYGGFHRPDEIIDNIFKLHKEYSFTEIAVELDGLEEFLMQPLRNEQLKRGIVLPLIPVRAPKNKDLFITGLQPFYIAGEVLHAKSLPELDTQLLQFPKGRKDILNALAYALRLRAGRPVYEDFQDAHVAEALELDERRPPFLVMSARPAITAGALVQLVGGCIRVYEDWLIDAPPLEAFKLIVDDATLVAARKVEVVVPMEQFEKYTGHGIPGAARVSRVIVTPGAMAGTSEGVLKPYLQKIVQGEPAFLVADEARWVLNGLAGGYSRKLNSAGVLQEKPEDNQYRIMLEAIEAFVGWFGTMHDDVDNDPNRRYDTTKDGRQYLTTLPGRRHG
jgi:hypothetical protein